MKNSLLLFLATLGMASPAQAKQILFIGDNLPWQQKAANEQKAANAPEQQSVGNLALLDDSGHLLLLDCAFTRKTPSDPPSILSTAGFIAMAGTWKEAGAGSMTVNYRTVLEDQPWQLKGRWDSRPRNEKGLVWQMIGGATPTAARSIEPSSDEKTAGLPTLVRLTNVGNEDELRRLIDFIEKTKPQALTDQLLAEVRKQENAIFGAHVDEDQNVFHELDALRSKERSLMQLEHEGMPYAATSVYIAPGITNKYECQGIYADSTIHTTEGDIYMAIPWQSGQTFKVIMAWPMDRVETLDFYAGEPGEMHQNGYKNVRPIQFDGATGILKYEPQNKDAHELLFGILKLKNDGLYRKFVFVIDGHARAGSD